MMIRTFFRRLGLGLGLDAEDSMRLDARKKVQPERKG